MEKAIIYGIVEILKTVFLKNAMVVPHFQRF